MSCCKTKSIFSQLSCVGFSLPVPFQRWGQGLSKLSLFCSLPFTWWFTFTPRENASGGALAVLDCMYLCVCAHMWGGWMPWVVRNVPEGSRTCGWKVWAGKKGRGVTWVRGTRPHWQALLSHTHTHIYTHTGPQSALIYLNVRPNGPRLHVAIWGFCPNTIEDFFIYYWCLLYDSIKICFRILESSLLQAFPSKLSYFFGTSTLNAVDGLICS